MSKQDLTALDDKEFEVLCCQLLSNVFDSRFERFKSGKDAGVDGRYFRGDKAEVVLQCKHWARSSISSLLRSLKNTELPKVTKLKPARYIFATSMVLSRADKQKIAAIFFGYVTSDSDVLGYEDICDLLSKYPAIYKEFPRLWLSSAEVIGLIENAAILGRSEYSLSEIQKRAIKYVETTSHRLAKERLEDLGTVLITGLPGIGKTTLADQLCLGYVLDNYELCVLGQSIEEAENIYKKDVKQVFYFDDFVGSNYLEALNRHEDSRIVGFIKRVSKDPFKRFILTSRTTILNQAKVLSDRFSIEKINRNEFEIRVESLTPLERAHILHKHIWYSDLAPEFVDQILSAKRYREIISHQNFNPRLIQFITDAQRFDEPNPVGYWEYVKRTLSNPTAIWEHVFESQLDDYSRALVLLVAFNAGAIRESDLRSAFELFRQEVITRDYRGSHDFVRQSKLVTGSVLNRHLGQGGAASFTLFNPSIADYVLQRVAGDNFLVEAVFSSLNTFSSLRNLVGLAKNKLFPFDVNRGFVESLVCKKLHDEHLDINYRVMLAQLGMKFISASKPIKAEIALFLTSSLVVDETFDHWNILGELLCKSIQHGLLTSRSASRFFCALDRQSYIDKYDMEEMLELFGHLEDEEKTKLEPILKRHIVEFWEDSITETVSESPLIGDYLSEDDASEVSVTALTIIEELLDEYPFRFSAKEIEKISDKVDSYEVIYQNQKSWGKEQHDDRKGIPLISNLDAIDELFHVDFPRAD